METRGWLAPAVRPGLYSPVSAGRSLVRPRVGGYFENGLRRVPRYERGPWAFGMPYYWHPERYRTFGDTETAPSPAAGIVAAFARSEAAGMTAARDAGPSWVTASRVYVGLRAATEPELTEAVDRATRRGRQQLAEMLSRRLDTVRAALKVSATPSLAVGDRYDYAHHGVPRWISTVGFALTVGGLVFGIVSAARRSA